MLQKLIKHSTKHQICFLRRKGGKFAFGCKSILKLMIYFIINVIIHWYVNSSLPLILLGLFVCLFIFFFIFYFFFFNFLFVFHYLFVLTTVFSTMHIFASNAFQLYIKQSKIKKSTGKIKKKIVCLLTCRNRKTV